MQDSISRDTRLVLDLALTIRHDGQGGVADDLTDPAGLTAWVQAHPGTVAPGFAAGDAELAAVRELRARSAPCSPARYAREPRAPPTRPA